MERDLTKTRKEGRKNTASLLLRSIPLDQREQLFDDIEQEHNNRRNKLQKKKLAEKTQILLTPFTFDDIDEKKVALLMDQKINLQQQIKEEEEQQQQSLLADYLNVAISQPTFEEQKNSVPKESVSNNIREQVKNLISSFEQREQSVDESEDYEQINKLSAAIPEYVSGSLVCNPTILYQDSYSDIIYVAKSPFMYNKINNQMSQDVYNFQYKTLLQIPNCNLIFNSKRNQGSRDTVLNLLSHDQNLIQLVATDETKCTSVQICVNNERNFIAGLSNTGINYYQLWQYSMDSMTLRRKVKWMIPKQMDIQYDDDDEDEELDFSIFSIDSNSRGDLIATLDNQFILRITDVDQNLLRYESPPQERVTQHQELDTSSACRWLRDFSVNHIAKLKSYSNAFRILDVEKQQYANTFFHNYSHFTNLDISNDGKIGLATSDGAISLFDVRNNKLINFYNSPYTPNKFMNSDVPDGLRWNNGIDSYQILTYTPSELFIIDIRGGRGKVDPFGKISAITKSNLLDVLPVNYGVQTACFI